MSASISEYGRLAPAFIDANAALSDADIFRPVAAYLPKGPETVLDIGAGIGRTAAWLESAGMHVTAVEPVAAFRAAGQTRFGDLPIHWPIHWIDDSLPHLDKTHALKTRFDTVILCGVWHHLPPHHRIRAMQRISQLVSRPGRILISLRHGPGAAGVTTYPTDPEETVALAHANTLKLEFRTTAPSVQKTNRTQGVTWTWLSLRKQ